MFYKTRHCKARESDDLDTVIAAAIAAEIAAYEPSEEGATLDAPAIQYSSYGSAGMGNYSALIVFTEQVALLS